MRQYINTASVGALLSASLLFLSACGQDVTLGTKSMTDEIPLVTIPGAPIPSSLGLRLGLAIDGRILGIEADSQFLTFARVRNFQLAIQDSSESDSGEDGSLDDFDFLSGLSVSIRAELNGAIVEELVAFLPDGDPQIGTGVRAIDLSVVDTDILDFLQASSGYELVLSIAGRVPPDAVVLGGEVRYRVGVGL